MTLTENQVTKTAGKKPAAKKPAACHQNGRYNQHNG